MSTPTFPLLTTGARTQYPTKRTISFATRVLQFVDGSEQRIAVSQSAQRSWILSLKGLRDDESGAIEGLWSATLAGAQRFAFVDPLTNEVVPACRFAQAFMMVDAEGFSQSSTTTEVVEVLE